MRQWSFGQDMSFKDCFLGDAKAMFRFRIQPSSTIHIQPKKKHDLRYQVGTLSRPDVVINLFHRTI